MTGIDVMWESFCDTMNEWGRFYANWFSGVVQDLGPISYGYALLTVGLFGVLILRGKDAWKG